MLNSVYIKGLYGLYDYTLDFTQGEDKRLKIITGPNGYGKTTVTDRERIRSMSDVRSKKEDVYVRTDTVYIEGEADKTVAVAGPGTLIDADGNISHQPSYITLLKWLFFVLLAVIVLTLLIRVKH